MIAASVGTYLFLKGKVKKPHIWIVYYLWLVIVVESYGFMVGFSKYTDYEYFGFLKDTFFQNRHWAFNISKFLSTTLFIIYFLNFIKKPFEKAFIKSFAIGYTLLFTYHLFNFDIFNFSRIPALVISSALLLFVTFLIFFLNLLRSDKIINLRTHFPFYVAVGYLFFIISTTPLEFYFKYYNLEINELYVNLRATVYLYVNLFLYSTLTIGFIVCFNKKKSF